ncbi:hypothetical protein [Phaeocystidibacter marisrubri]|uniref:Uncharacterized protein n=1 Tax=Phaeocystidibacter marisrubri TaxID=1577780 RepID=A0A6L3ZCH3_9FLAO|nr:hypothetical protein [Phaeocystidibacter marisrubri]KAB2815137.1 hypothetical protein F8C82_13645 [Phaeocystidibacter marisrubri]GGH70525.1 hypothetical protein GCM10011318_12610 [Phaeocystidibacter marisrubri]
MKLAGVNYIVWALLTIELIVFGYPTLATFIIGGLIVALLILRFLTRNSNKWREAQTEFDKANILPPVLFNPLIILFTLAALILPYFSGEVILPLYVFVAAIWLVR